VGEAHKGAGLENRRGRSGAGYKDEGGGRRTATSVPGNGGKLSSYFFSRDLHHAQVDLKVSSHTSRNWRSGDERGCTYGGTKRPPSQCSLRKERAASFGAESDTGQSR